MSRERQRRVAGVVRQVVSESLGQLSDPGLGFVTVTGVEVTPEFETARVYVQVLGGERRRERGLAALERARGVLQERVARQMSLRRTPQLSFHYDESLDRSLRIGELIAGHEFLPDEPDEPDEPGTAAEPDEDAP